MDIGLREWLIIGGVLIIGLIIFDGWRRMKGHRNTLKMDIDRQFSEQSDSEHNPELPNGGARIKSHANPAYIAPERSFVAAERPFVAPERPFVAERSDEPAVSSFVNTNVAERVEPSFAHIDDHVDEPKDNFTSLEQGNELADEHIESEEERASYIPEVDHYEPQDEYLPENEPEVRVEEEVKAVVSQPVIRHAEEVVDAEDFDPLFDEIPESFTKAYKREESEYSPTPAPLTSNYDAAEPAITTLNIESVTPEFSAEEEQEEHLDAEDQVEVTQSSPLSHADVVESVETEALDLEQPITVLMRQVSEQAAKREEKLAQHDMFSAVEEKASVADQPASQLVPDTTVKESVVEKPKRRTKPIKEPEIEPEAPAQDSLFDDLMLENARSDRKAREHVPEPEEVLVITVVGKNQPLDGHALLQVVLACGMRFGDMSLFHRFEEGIDKGAVQFSMANAVNPGTFDLENMPTMATPGVSFFMSMSEPADPKNAFECMLATAETVAKHLGGDLLDENRSVMRPQTKAHYRERISEYEMHNRRRRSH